MRITYIWYKSPSSRSVIDSVAREFSRLAPRVMNEYSTVEQQNIPKLLRDALAESDTVIITGGLKHIRENENIIFILAKCLGLTLEYDSRSRSRFMFDSIRGRALPSFTDAVLFPYKRGEPEGVLLRAGSQQIIILPKEEAGAQRILAAMGTYIVGSRIEEALDEEEEVQIPQKRTMDDRLREIEERRKEKEEQMRIRAVEVDRNTFRRSVAREMEHDLPAARETNRAIPRTQDEPQMRRKEHSRESKPIFMARFAAIAVLVLFIGAVWYVAANYYETTSVPTVYYSDVVEMYSENGESEESDYLPSGALAQFAKLYTANPDVRGYITVPGTGIDMPVMQSQGGREPNYYSRKDYYGNDDVRGSLYFSVENSIKKSEENKNLVIYGNSPADGTVFGNLSKYLDLNFFASNPVIRMDTLYEKAQWRVFAVCICSSDTIYEFNYANTNFPGKYSVEKHLYELFIRSKFLTDCEVFPTDNLLTLVTDYDGFEGGKLIIAARQLREDEDIAEAGNGIVANPDALMPEIWYGMTGEKMPSVPEFEYAEEYREEHLGPSTTTVTTTTVSTTTTTKKTTTTTTGKKTTTSKKKTTTKNTTTTTRPSDVSGSDSSAEDTTKKTTTTTKNGSSSSYPKTMRIKSNGKIIEKDTATVLAMIVEAEMGSGYQTEALKAQTVAAYTYYKYSGGAAKAPSFPTKSTPSTKVKNAVKAVLGEYMTVGGKVKYTPYYAISAGKTASNASVNGTKLSHLVSVDCSVDKKVSGYKVSKTVKASWVASRIKSKKGINLNSISDKSQWFKIISRDSNDLYITKIQIGKSYTCRGSTLYLSILGYKCLRSPCFDIKYNASDDTFTFTSYGYGHCVGMSQKGANEYAKQGKDYRWILEHFYTGVEIKG